LYAQSVAAANQLVHHRLREPLLDLEAQAFRAQLKRRDGNRFDVRRQLRLAHRLVTFGKAG
jgi:hypothetical protein